MAQKRYTSGSKKNNDNANKEVTGVILIVVSAFLLINLIIPMIFGALSRVLSGALHGTFGFSVYPILVCMLLLGIAFVQKRKLRVQPKYVAGIGIISILIIFILQLATSHKLLTESAGIGGYLLGVYQSFTGGGAFFGVFVYAIQAVLTEVFSYIVYALLIILTGFLMAKDKLKSDYDKVHYAEKERGEGSAFKKGIRPAQQVQPLKDTKLFVETIRPSEKPYVSASGNFNSMALKQSDNMQTYSSAPENKSAFNEIMSDKKVKALNFMNDIKNTPVQLYSVKETGEQPVQNQNILPQQAMAAPDIHNSFITPVEAAPPKKPPKILHFEDLGLPEIALPPPKEIPEVQSFGAPIINGAEMSRRLADERVGPKPPVPAYDGFDRRKAEPVQAVPKREPSYESEVPQTNGIFKQPERMPEITQAPIVNGDYFKDKSAAAVPSASTDRTSFSVDEIENGITKTGRAGYVPLIKKPGPEEDSRPQYSEPAPATSFLENLAKLESMKLFADAKNKSRGNESVSDKIDDGDNDYDAETVEGYADDGEVEDLSEKSYNNPHDNTGYYNEIKEEKQGGKIDFGNAPPLKLKPENQIKLDDYAKKISSVPEKPKQKRTNQKYIPPPIELLSPSVSNVTEDAEADSNEKARILEETLRGLKLPATVCAITRGPAVTRYELEMPPGIPVKRIEQFVKDIEYNLASNGRIRIETPIPGKRAVGIEVPNSIVDIVALKDIINSKEFVNSSSPITLAMGKDIAGANIVCSLDKMPHLLIAGATGSGKSACLNSIIISILYKSSPDDVRIILIDPKQVEFSIFRDLPHLLTNEIITDSNQALNAFKWVKFEMERRYTLFSQHVVRNITEYNKLEEVRSGDIERLPNIVLIVDELAELMMSSNRKDLEEKIMSMAQKARAAGIHLILATQRPSVDVITGTIKANLPSRIAFAVKSVIDSRTILDSSGAETLLGRGDMLYAPMGVDDPRRVQGAYVTSEEVAVIANYVRENNQSDFDEDFKSALTVREETPPDEPTGADEESEFDPLMPQVLKLLMETGTVSTTFLQRRFAIGYARAARIMDQMETHNFVGPMENGKPRTVCITREQYKELFGEESL